MSLWKRFRGKSYQVVEDDVDAATEHRNESAHLRSGVVRSLDDEVGVGAGGRGPLDYSSGGSPPSGLVGTYQAVILDEEQGSRSKSGVGEEEDKGKALNIFTLIAVVYFLVCGGAYGTENLAGSIPPLFALLGLIIVPWLWSLPIAFIVAELGSSLPSEHGFLLWTKEAWGPFLSFIDGFILVVVVVIDQALYPVIFISYLSSITDFEGWEEYVISIGYIGFALLLNLLGAASVGNSSSILTMITLVPFGIFVVLGYSSDSFDFSRLLATSRDDGKPWDLALYLSVLVWATCGFEYSGFLAGDVKNPKRTFPMAMFGTVILMLLTYLMPMSTSIGVASSISEIKEGAYPKLAEELGYGDWPGWLMVGGGLGSTLGTYLAYLHTSSTALRSMANEGFAPSIFRAFPEHRTPYVALVFFSLTTCVLILFEFEVLVQIESFLYCIHAIILCSSLPRIRMKRPELERPFSLPFGKVGAIVLPLLPACISLAQVGSLWAENWLYCVAAVGVLLLGGASYWLSPLWTWAVELLGAHDLCCGRWKRRKEWSYKDGAVPEETDSF
ncbi:proline dehydrogenase [Balamuthia mandrillaris]